MHTRYSLIKIISALILSCVVLSTSAQYRKFSAGPTLNFKNDQYAYNDPAGRLFPILNQMQLQWGFTGQWYKSKKWTTETGIFFIQTSRSAIDFNFPINSLSVLTRDSPVARCQFVVRQYFNWINLKNRLGHIILIGPSMGFKLTTHQTDAGGIYYLDQAGMSSPSVPEIITSTTRSSYPSSMTFALEPGFSVNYFINSRIRIQGQYTYQLGLQTTIISEVTYSSSLSPSVNKATIMSRGTGGAFGIQVGYLFGSND